MLFHAATVCVTCRNVYVVVVPMKKAKSPPATPDDVDLDEVSTAAV